jgi:hypothetical protein
MREEYGFPLHNVRDWNNVYLAAIPRRGRTIDGQVGP